MKPSAALAIVLSIVAMLVWAPTSAQPQTLAPAAGTAAIAAATTPPEETQAAEQRKSRRWLKADARVCLEFPNDAQIIKCSQKYR
jgi:hypothetical protein